MIVVGNASRLNQLSRLAASWGSTLYVRLFGNVVAITPDTESSWFTPPSAPGLLSQQQILGWRPPILSGDVAILAGLPVAWVRGSGGPPGVVIGYYVVDSSGVFQWGETNPAGPTYLADAGDIYQVNPVYALWTQYGG